MEKKKRTVMSRIVIASAVFLMLSMCIVPASAWPELPDHNETLITMANGAFYNTSIPGDDYYFGFNKSGGGLKALHISDSPLYEDKSGAVYTNKGNTGSFYITDMSKDPGCADSAILLFGVNNSIELDRNFSLQINASGYNWTLVGDGGFPTVGDDDLAHYNDVNIGEFDRDDFTYLDDYKPYFDDNYPLYYGSSGGSNYKLMFIDLGLGLLNTTPSALTDNGSIKIDYTITNSSIIQALFNVYAWRNQSKQGSEVVSWTNRLIDDEDGLSSGWTIGF